MTDDNNQSEQEKLVLESREQEIYRLGFVPNHYKSEFLLALELELESDEADFGGVYLGQHRED